MNAPLTDVWSGYSLLRSLFTVPDLVKELARRGFGSALLADFETLAGTEEFDRLMRQAGLFPLVGVTRLFVVGGMAREIRLVAEMREAWPHLVRFRQWNGEPVQGLTVVVAASADPWWQRLAPARTGLSVVVELKPEQRSLVGRLPQGWCWVPASRVRFARPGDRPALELLGKIGGLARDPDASALPSDPATWLAPFQGWPDDRLWTPEPHDSFFFRRVWKMPRLADVADEAGKLRQDAQQGLTKRFAGRPTEEAQARLAYELDTIQELGFAGYFLMVADMVGWARNRGIRVGPGRGSAAGSLVSYALFITDVDPLQYGLVFERFLNPARRTLPDIDVDFEDTRRGEVIQYLRERHGRDQVAQIGTYGTLGARAALRDVARVAGLSHDRVSEVVRAVEWGIGDTLAQHAAVLKEASLKAQMGTEWIDQAMRLEGLPRHRSTHAAGVIIAPQPLTDWLYCHGDPDSGWVTDFDMGSLEQLGFVKLDVLGLRTLSMLSRAEQSLGFDSDAIGTVDGRDPKTLKLLGRGDTDGVFQLDGRGVKALLRQMRPASREEVMLVVALYRPGPMDAIGELLRRRQAGYQPDPNDPLESLLRETYGIMVYQEQLMEAVQRVAGFTLAEADLVRRAISKKDHAMLNQEGDRLVANMMERGYARKAADAFWERIRAFGDYGFNKAHAASYGMMSYYLAYLKANHPLQFWAAELSQHETGEKLKDQMVQAVSQGVVIRPPHVNTSDVGFTVAQGEVQAGLGIIRGLGPDAAERIVQSRRQDGRYVNVAELARRLGHGPNLRLLEALEHAGALSGLGSAKDAASTQIGLFDVPDILDDQPTPNYLEAFGFGWPEADGPIYVRLFPDQDSDEVMREIEWLARRLPGPVPCAVIAERGRARPVNAARFRWGVEAIEAIKMMDGVQAAGRHVSPRSR